MVDIKILVIAYLNLFHVDFSDKIDTKYAGPLTYTYLNTDQVSKSSNNECNSNFLLF